MFHLNSAHSAELRGGAASSSQPKIADVLEGEELMTEKRRRKRRNVVI